MDAPAVAVVHDTRVGAAAELGADTKGAFLGTRAYVTRDLAERVSLGAAVAWTPFMSWSRTQIVTVTPTGAEPLLGNRQKGRALFFFSLRTGSTRAEAAVALGLGLAGEWREAEYPDGSTSWRTVVPSFVAESWASGRIWLSSFIALEVEVGAIVTNEPRYEYELTHYRAVVAPVARAGVVLRF